MTNLLEAMSGVDLITPLNPWSLWVPALLLGLILMAAFYSVTLPRR